MYEIEDGVGRSTNMLKKALMIVSDFFFN